MILATLLVMLLEGTTTSCEPEQQPSSAEPWHLCAMMFTAPGQDARCLLHLALPLTYSQAPITHTRAHTHTLPRIRRAPQMKCRYGAGASPSAWPS